MDRRLIAAIAGVDVGIQAQQELYAALWRWGKKKVGEGDKVQKVKDRVASVAKRKFVFFFSLTSLPEAQARCSGVSHCLSFSLILAPDGGVSKGEEGVHVS